MRSERRPVVVATSLLILSTIWLGAPPEAAAGPAISRAFVTLDLTESQCVRKGQRSVARMREMDRTIRSEVDDETVWLSNESFTAMILCMQRRNDTLAVIVVAADSKSLAGAMRDNLRREMD